MPTPRPMLAALLLLPLLLTGAPSLLAADTPPAPAPWHAASLGEALGYMVLFAACGIAITVAGYKLFDRLTPGDLHREIFEHRNVAAAILAAAVILAVSLIVCAAMLG